jgi:hypothetical protein
MIKRMKNLYQALRTTAFLAGAFLAAAGFLAANLTGSLIVTRLTAIF